MITIDNYYEIFNGLLNPKQLEGVRRHFAARAEHSLVVEAGSPLPGMVVLSKNIEHQPEPTHRRD
jgi:hypothetical protein